MLKGSLDRIKYFSACVCDGASLMVGVPNYQAYVEHMGRTHPDQEPMSYEAFFRDRQDARFGGAARGGFRCC
jgi:uncharacterized short protein YbdD (DUF466 family)